jgi:bifunctional non-homologous end joining protein LigD
LRANSYFIGMPKTPYAPCIGKTVPAGPDWLDEIKHDGFRLIVQREGMRVRLFTHSGHDWSGRFPLTELRNRDSSL